MSKQASDTKTVEIFAQKGQAAPSVDAQEKAGGSSRSASEPSDPLFPHEVGQDAPESKELPPAGSLLSIDFRRLSDGERNQILSLKANKLPPRGMAPNTTDAQPLLPFPTDLRRGQASATATAPSAPALPKWRNLKETRGKDSDTPDEPPEATGRNGVESPAPVATEPPEAVSQPASIAEIRAVVPAPLPDPAPETGDGPPPNLAAPAATPEPPASDAPLADEPTPPATAAADGPLSIPPAAAATTSSSAESKRPPLGLAAMVALALLAGLGLWALLPSGEPADPTRAEPAVVTPAAPPVAAEADTAAAKETASEEPGPSFDLIRVEPNGEAVLAGRAAPHASLIILDNDIPIGSVKADGAGEWAFIPERPLPPGDHAFSLVVSAPQGEVVLPARKSEPAPQTATPATADTQASDDAAAASAPLPEESAPKAAPKVPQASEGTAPKPPLPVTKPPAKHSSLPGIKHYGVQLSSNSSEEAALRSWKLLRQRFPGLLGDKELLIQKAQLQDGKTRFRVRTSLVGNPQTARKLCDTLRAQNQECLVFRESSVPAKP